MSSIDLIFGAPVTVPAGNPLASASKAVLFLFNFPFTLETICMTCEKYSITIFSVTFTLPYSETFPTSFLAKSINIKCSANSF